MGPKRPTAQPYSRERFESAKKTFLRRKRNTALRMDDPGHSIGPYILRSRRKMTPLRLEAICIDHDNDGDYDPSPQRPRKRKSSGKHSQSRKKRTKTPQSSVISGVISGVNEHEEIDANTPIASYKAKFTCIDPGEDIVRQLVLSLTGFNMPSPSEVEENTVSTELSFSTLSCFPETQQSKEVVPDFPPPAAT